MKKCFCGQVADYNVLTSKVKKKKFFCEGHMVNYLTETDEFMKIDREPHMEKKLKMRGPGGYIND